MDAVRERVGPSFRAVLLARLGSNRSVRCGPNTHTHTDRGGEVKGGGRVGIGRVE